MIAHTTNLLDENRECLEILFAYQKSEESFGDQAGNIWSQRLLYLTSKADDDEEVVIDQSSRAHGLLIAYGFLDIELAGRDAGIQYRITSEGKKSLASALKMKANSSES